MNESFKYLGKLFNANMDISEAKAIVQNKLEKLLIQTTEFKIKAQLKLKILKFNISNQLSFDLRIYDFSFTWIAKQLGCNDNQTRFQVVGFTDQYMRGRILRVAQKPRRSWNHIVAEKIWLGLRLSLKLSAHGYLKNIWSATRRHNVNLVSFSNKKSAYASLKSAQQQKIPNHLSSLKIQGSLQKVITDSFSKACINDWSSFVEELSETLPLCSHGSAATTSNCCQPLQLGQM